MCNVYETPTPDQMEFDFAAFERPNESYKASIGPRDSGPFVVQGKIRVGQWGMIRPGSRERVARDAKGRPLMTNNARTERMATAPTYRDAWRSTSKPRPGAAPRAFSSGNRCPSS